MTETTSSSPEPSNSEIREYLGVIRDLIPTDARLNWLREPGLIELAANVEVLLDYMKKEIAFSTLHTYEKKVELIKRKDAEYALEERIKEVKRLRRRQADLVRIQKTIDEMKRNQNPSPFSALGI